MDAPVTSFPSILDKPLSQLTEEDISQLTREDCRKYLKEKGMRRPSWNKSQAIQQVISLKALLETSEDSGAGALRRILVAKTPPATQNSADRAKEASVDANNNVLVPVEEIAPTTQNDSPKARPIEASDCNPEEADVKVRSPCSVNEFVGQMTIFYCGKVNVYDGVNPNKAQAIMHLAANPIQLPFDDGIRGNSPFAHPCNLHSPSENCGLITPAATIAPTTQTGQQKVYIILKQMMKLSEEDGLVLVDNDEVNLNYDLHLYSTEKLAEYYQHFGERANITYVPEGQVNRQVSLQRYREKKKDRVRFKGKRNLGPNFSSVEPYINLHASTQISNVQLIGSNSSSPHQAGLSHNLSSSANSRPKTASLSVDLNEDFQEF